MDVKTIEEIHADCDPAVCDVRPILTERDALKAELTELHETYETAHASRLHAESVTARLEADNKRLRAECERMERRLAERALSGAKLRELREAVMLAFDPSAESMVGLFERVSGLNRVRLWALKPTWSTNARIAIAFVLRDIADAVEAKVTK